MIVMNVAQTAVSSKDLESAAELAKSEKLQAKLQRLLREAAEVEVELSRAEGAIQGVPHYSVIESRAHELGQQLSRQVQRRQMNELAASHAPTAKCPGCGTRCELEIHQREVNSVDGSLPLQELVGKCPCCRKSFFPVA
jgi:DNA repair exonuclease SbcCD ATPase subunit